MQSQPTWVSLGQIDTLPETPSSHLIGRDTYGAPVEALLLRLESGEWRAYLNVCQHLPVPLGPKEYTDENGLLICHLHGARYRPADGHCVSGPCKGAKLEPLRLRNSDGLLELERPIGLREAGSVG